MQAIIWSWQEAKKVTDAFACCLEQCEEMGMASIARSYTSMMGALEVNGNVLVPAVLSSYHQLAQQCAGKHWRMFGWVAMGVDGSRLTTPRTKSNEAAFCAENYGQGKRAKYGKKKSQGLRRQKNVEQQQQATPQVPQVFLTMIWHMQLRLPWFWKAGRSSSSERCETRELLNDHDFPDKTLLCGDAGFTGFEFWKDILANGLDFLVRVGGNVSLLSNEVDIEHGKGGIIYCWPQGKRRSELPLRLRLVQVTVGKTKMWMLTSVTEPRELTELQIIKFYKMRWGIEVEFRGLKQTLERVKLNCRTSERVYVELDWSLLGMGIAELLATHQQIIACEQDESKNKYTPQRRSLAQTMRAIRYCLRNLARQVTANASMFDRLAGAVVQKYKNKTDKRARHRHKNPDKKKLGDPQIQFINSKEMKAKIEKVTLANAV